MTASDFEAQCLAVLDQLASGALVEIVITKRGVPVATRGPPPRPPGSSIYGALKGCAVIAPGADIVGPILEDEPEADRPNVRGTR